MIRYLKVKNTEDLRLVINYMMNFKQQNFVSQIFDNPSLNYFYGLDDIIKKICDSKYIFYYDDVEEKIIITNSNGKVLNTLATVFVKEEKKFTIKININKKTKVTIFTSDEDITVLKTDKKTKIFNSPINILEYMIFDKYGLENRYLRVNSKNILSISREENGYIATACVARDLENEPLVKTYNIDINTPMLEFSNGKVVDEFFLIKDVKARKLNDEDLEKYIMENSKYLAEDTRNRLLELALHKEIGDKKIK